MANFFKVFCAYIPARWRWITELLLKNGTVDGYAYQPCYCQDEFTSPWVPGTLEIFAKSLCQIQVKTKKSLSIWAPGPKLVLRHIMVNTALVNVLYVHKKARCGPEIATFRTKILHFFRIIRINWQATINLSKPGAPGLLVSYCC